MYKKSGQILLVTVFVSIFGVLSSYAQEHLNSWKFPSRDTLQPNWQLQPGTGLKSNNGKYVAVMQKDGNFCLYEVNDKAQYGVNFIHCSMTNGNEGAYLWMKNDGNLLILNNNKEQKQLLVSSTNKGDKATQVGKVLKLRDDGRLVVIGWDNKTIVYDFQKGRTYDDNAIKGNNDSANANKSGCSIDKVANEIPINWVNKTRFSLRFEWIGFDCQPVEYATVNPGETFKQSSYNGHVWRISYYASESDEPRWIELKKITLSPSNKSMNITMD
jgi:hypothetical protein